MSQLLPPPEHPLAQKALVWGVATWIGNGLGCLIGMVPIALPLSIVAVVVTFITGIGAMWMGARAKREAAQAGLTSAVRDARIGFWLGASHVVVVFLMAAGVGVAWQQGLFS